MEETWITLARELGFSEAAVLNPATLQPRQDVRDMCRANTCRAYGKNWTCPPYCGTLAQCEEKLHSYSHGILVQTVGQLAKTIDTRAMREAEKQHCARFLALCGRVREVYPNALCLGAGGCRVCPQCAHPEPCRFPDRAYPSMEGYGLFVTQVCKDNGFSYHHGEKTVTYTSCLLF